MRQVIDQELRKDEVKLSFHSLRHYVQNQLDHAGVDDKVVRDLIGHEGKDIHDKVYRKSSSPQTLLEAIEMLPIITQLRFQSCLKTGGEPAFFAARADGNFTQ